MSQTPRVWFITGTSTGFGRELALVALERGDKVVATARKPETLTDIVQQYPDQAVAVRLDVTKLTEIAAAVAQAVDTFGRIDVVVNNAGYGVFGTVEEISSEMAQQQFDTNFFGALQVTQAILPTLRHQRSGHVINISSVGGFIGFPGVGIYSASKFALEGISEALAQEVAPLGIKVTIVEPGAFRTAFVGNIVGGEQVAADYQATGGQVINLIRSIDQQQPGDPRKAALAILQVVDSPQPPLRLPLGEDAVLNMEAKLRTVQAEVAAWREVAVNTAYEGAQVFQLGEAAKAGNS
jgi:NAD(P)-dependent dehydrogenase (short-subunit alcohol dehydrogenase family)